MNTIAERTKADLTPAEVYASFHEQLLLLSQGQAEELDKLRAYITKLEGALWNSTRNMQDIVKYGEKACNADFKAAIEKNRKLLAPTDTAQAARGEAVSDG